MRGTLPRMNRTAKFRLILLSLLPLLLVCGYAAKMYLQRYSGVIPVAGMMEGNDVTQPSPLATWPLPAATKERTHRGVTHWFTHRDGTTVDVFRFSWQENPRLRFEILDGDSDDEKPWDGRVKYWNRGVAQATKLLNDRKNGPVLAAWNGLFFGYASPQITTPQSEGFHVSPVVIDGKVRDNTANHRWAFGVKYTDSGPQWSIAHKPPRDWLEQNLQWGGGSAQCLVLDGKPLQLQPFPRAGDAPLPQPVPSTPDEAGHIPQFDHMKTCRASLAWEKDGKTLWLVFVKESDGETASALALKYRRALQGGWTTADVQSFWLALQKQTGSLTAINSDAGDVAQLAFLQPDGDYTLVPPRWSGATFDRKTFAPDFQNAPHGGALMFFYVREAQ
jgi:hypothetical protein